MFKGSEGVGADVVLDAFGVHLGDAFGDAERAEKGDDGFVASFARGGEVAALIGEEDGAIGLGGDKAAFLQAGNGAIDGHVGHTEALGEVHDAGFAGFGNEIGDGFDIIFGDLVGMLAAGLGEVFGLAFTLGPRRLDLWCSHVVARIVAKRCLTVEANNCSLGYIMIGPKVKYGDIRWVKPFQGLQSPADIAAL